MWADSARLESGKGPPLSCPAKRGRGTMRSMVEGASAARLALLPPPPPPPFGRSPSPATRGRMMPHNRSMKQKTEPDFIAPAVAAELKGWLEHLGGERNYSAKTVEAYRRDVVQFLGFLAEHL